MSRFQVCCYSEPSERLRCLSVKDQLSAGHRELVGPSDSRKERSWLTAGLSQPTVSTNSEHLMVRPHRKARRE